MTDAEDTTDMSKLPAPVAAALGLVPTVLDGARRLPAKAATIPVLAVSSALTVMETARREYDELATRGERFIDQMRGRPADEEQATSAPAQPETPTRVDTAATAEVVETVEAVAATVDAPEVTSHDELPLPDYDHMTLGSLRGRLRSLTVEELVQIRDYEKGHGNRLPVVTLLDNRIAKLATDAAAEPSPGGELPVLPTPAETSTPPAAAPSRGKATNSPPRTKVRHT